jgi:hypothetical protein
MAPTYLFNRVVGGITVRYDRCDHCGKLPSDKDIQDQLALIGNNFSPCVICGKKPEVMEATLRHFKQGKVDRWGGEVLATQILEELHYGNQGFWVHHACAVKALPHAELPKEG